MGYIKYTLPTRIILTLLVVASNSKLLASVLPLDLYRTGLYTHMLGIRASTQHIQVKTHAVAFKAAPHHSTRAHANANSSSDKPFCVAVECSDCGGGGGGTSFVNCSPAGGGGGPTHTTTCNTTTLPY